MMILYSVFIEISINYVERMVREVFY